MKLAQSRRRFLKAVGLGATALPFYRLLEHSAVHAQAGTGPLRFIAMFHPHGAASPLFRRRPGDTETQFELNFIEPMSGAQSVLAPFDDAATYGTSFKDKLIVLDGLDLVAGQGGHDAPGQILTGAGNGNVEWSLDQYLAVGLGLGSATRISSLVLGIGNRSTEYINNLSFGQGGGVLPQMIDPQQTFNTLFADLILEQDPAAAAELERTRREGRSMIDFLKADIDALYPRLAPTEARKLDQHLTSLRDIEKRLEAFGNACQVPATPVPFERLERFNQGEPNFNAITDLQIDLLAQAMACDLTRFATLWTNELSAGAIAGTGITHPRYGESVDVHNSIAHSYLPPQGTNFGGGGTIGDPSSWEVLAVQHRYSYTKAARLMQRLQEFGILDDSLLLFATDMGNPSAHSSRNVPFVLGGGAGGQLGMGRHIQFGDDCPPDRVFCEGSDQATVPHNRLLVSIANLFGAEIGSFGSSPNPADASGELSELG